MKTEVKKYNIGIVGCGNISKTHAEAILHTTNGNLIAAFSRTESTLAAFCDQYDITAYSSYKDFIANGELDIVVICTPTGTHLDYAELAAQNGKHIIVEKPIEVTVERGQLLVQQCKKNKVKLAVIYQNRFIDSIIQMKEAIDHGDIGRPIMARGTVKWYRSQEYYSESSWRGTYALDGGGAVINQSIHTIDLLQWFMGGIESVSAFKENLTHNSMEAEDNAVSCFRFSNGALGVFEASTSIVPAQDRRVEINGTKGTAILEGNTFYKQFDDEKVKADSNDQAEAAGSTSPLAGMGFKDHKEQYEQILNAINQDKNPVVSGQESLQSLAVVEALYTSANKNKTVAVDEVISKANSI